MNERLMTKEEAVAYLRDEVGIPMTMSVFSKVTMPSRPGEGPPVDAHWGRRPLWKGRTLRSWAMSRIVPAGGQIA
jgi:hypothetical protein